MKGPFRKARASFRRTKRLPTSLQAFLACAIVVLAAKLWLRSSKEDGILIYVPVHHKSIANLWDFASCMTQAKPVVDNSFRTRVDVLIVTNGDRELNEKDADDVQRAIRLLKKGLRRWAVSKVRSQIRMFVTHHRDRKSVV